MRLNVFRAQMFSHPYDTAPKCPRAQMSASRCLAPKCQVLRLKWEGEHVSAS